MTASVELKSKKELIKQILTDYPETRSCDRRCQIEVWKKEIGTFDNVPTFFADYIDGFYTLADSITRIKRDLQKKHPELAGINKDSEEEKCREIFTGEFNFPSLK